GGDFPGAADALDFRQVVVRGAGDSVRGHAHTRGGKVAIEHDGGRDRVLGFGLGLVAGGAIAFAAGLVALDVLDERAGGDLEGALEVTGGPALDQLDGGPLRIAGQLFGRDGARPARLARRMVVAGSVREKPQDDRDTAEHAHHGERLLRRRIDFLLRPRLPASGTFLFLLRTRFAWTGRIFRGRDGLGFGRHGAQAFLRSGRRATPLFPPCSRLRP